MLALATIRCWPMVAEAAVDTAVDGAIEGAAEEASLLSKE